MPRKMFRVHNLIAQNAFRILGLPATASLDDIQRAEGTLRRSLKLSADKPTAWDMSWLGSLKRTEADVREAVGRLTTSPAMRLEQRLFWFEGEPPAGIELVAAPPHNLALLGLLGALRDRELQEENAWRRCIDAWQLLVKKDDYWVSLLNLEVASGFEPAADSREIEVLRERSLDRMLDDITALAREALASRESGRCRRALGLLRGAGLSPKQMTRCENAIFGASEDAIVASCTAIRRECADRILRDEAQAQTNRLITARAIQRFEAEVGDQLDRLLELAGRESATGTRLAEAASTCLSGLARDTTWADDYASASDLLGRARALLPDHSLARAQLDAEQERVTELALQQRHSARVLLATTVPEVRFEELCASLRFACREQIKQEQDAAVANRKACRLALDRYDREALPALNDLLDKHGTDSNVGRRIRTASAMCLISIALDLSWANEFKLAELTLSQALALAPDGSEARQRGERALQQFPQAASSRATLASARMKMARVWECITPISAAPTLRTVNGFGCMLYGAGDPLPVPGSITSSHLSTYYVTIFFIPVFPISRYRLINSGRGSYGSYRFLYKVPLTTFDKCHLGVAAAIVLYAICSMMFGPSGSTHYAAKASSGTASVGMDASGKARNPIDDPMHEEGTSAPGKAARTGASPKVVLKSQIEANNRRLGALEMEVKKNKSEIERLQDQMRPLKSKIDEYESNARLGLDLDELAYQQAIDRFNRLVKQNNALISQTQSIIDEHNPLVSRTNAMIADYTNE